MSVLDFFVHLISIASDCINTIVYLFTNTLVLRIPLAIVIGCGAIGLVYKLIKG